MPRLNTAVPRYRRHRASGQAVVSLAGRDHYLGPYGTQVSKDQYDRLVCEWLARGRLPEVTHRVEPRVADLMAAYLEFAKGYYVKNGKLTNEVHMIKQMLEVLRPAYGESLAAEFGPLKLQAMQTAMIRKDWSRGFLNKQISRIRRMFRWGVTKEIVPAAVYQALVAVPDLARGRSDAREAPRVRPVEKAIVEATLGHLPPIVADMVRLQQLSGARPEAICNLKPSLIDRSGAVWIYQPESHKTEHLDRECQILFGPQAQALLKPYLERDHEAYCFSPQEAESARRAALQARRRTPLSCGNRPGTNRRPRPKRTPGIQYTPDSYRRAIHRACRKAKQPRWSPYRLRHTSATAIRKQFGLEAAQVILGHKQAQVTQIYAERDLEKGIEIMKTFG